MKIEMLELSKLTNYEKNSKLHSPEQIKKLADSMQRVGFTQPIVIDEHNVIVCGHGRFAGATLAGIAKVPCVRLKGLTDAQVRELRLFDNKVAESGWDSSLLKTEFDELSKLPDFQFELTGFDAQEFISFLPAENEVRQESEKIAKEHQEKEDDVPETPKNLFDVQRGQVWKLGAHRLMCGDSTSEADVAVLMSGQKADMVFTDPPYNLASHTQCIAAQKEPAGGRAYSKLKDSDWDKDFNISSFFKSAQSCLSENGSIYICTSHFFVGELIAWVAAWAKFHALCVWSKPNPMPSLTKRHWTWNTEFVVYATFGKHTFNFPEKGNAPSVWTINKNAKNDLHPTQKPVGVPEHAIVHSSNEDALVLDLFGGSGTTLIACEKTNRRCNMMEIDPDYCSVIIARWQKYTGGIAELQSESIIKSTFTND